MTYVAIGDPFPVQKSAARKIKRLKMDLKIK